MTPTFKCLHLTPQLHLTNVRPHTNLVIEEQENYIDSKCICKSVEEINRGNLTYQQQTYKLRPYLVSYYVDSRNSNYEPFTIGGLDVEEWGPSKISLINYRLIWVVKGQICIVTFGLDYVILAKIFQINSVML